MKSEINWRPSASFDLLKARARLNAQIRTFFEHASVMEVEVPAIGRVGVTDPYIDALVVNEYFSRGTGHLQTSPEYFMKRLLAAGSGDIYSLAKCFRAGESGRRHNPEFTMLEWYRLGFDDHQLMQEVSDLIGAVLPVNAVVKYSYKALFLRFLELDIAATSDADLLVMVQEKIDLSDANLDRDSSLDLLLSHCIEPELLKQHPRDLVFIYDYPASQAALAKILVDEQGDLVARRFEGFYGGFELCNGYWELTDANELNQRFSNDQAKRQTLGLAKVEADSKLLDAMDVGLPECAGVAMGIDRLLLLQQDCESISETLSFSHQHL